MCRSQFKEDGRSFEQIMARPGAHNAPLQSAYAAMPIAIIGGKESKAMFDKCSAILAAEMPRAKRFRVCTLLFVTSAGHITGVR